MPRAGYVLFATLAACLALGAIAVFLSGPLTTRAVQSPRMSLDMDPAGNSYDPATNTMTVGSVDSCLASPQANPTTHAHTAQLVIENVEDLVAWQVRLNYNGDEMRPAAVDAVPFMDSTTGQHIGFLNLPKYGPTSLHRVADSATDLPAAAPGPQSALFGSAYRGTQTFPVSPDTPAKNPPDDTSYGAPNGGVLAAVDLEVSGDQSGRTLFMQLDNDNPNPPGSRAVVFDGAGITDINLTSDELGNGYHAEGAETCSPVPTPKDLFADLRFDSVAVDARTSVTDGQAFDIRVLATVENRGPDRTDARIWLTLSSPVGCDGSEQNYMESVSVQALSVATFDHSEPSACYTANGPTRSATFHAVLNAYTNAYDPDLSNNEASGEITVVVIGTSAPNPTPEPDPTQVPNPPTPDPPSDPPPSDGSRGSDPIIAGAPPALQTSAPSPATVVLAAALPRSGGPGGGPLSVWELIAGGTLALAASAAVTLGIRRFVAVRKR